MQIYLAQDEDLEHVQGLLLRCVRDSCYCSCWAWLNLAAKLETSIALLNSNTGQYKTLNLNRSAKPFTCSKGTGQQNQPKTAIAYGVIHMHDMIQIH